MAETQDVFEAFTDLLRIEHALIRDGDFGALAVLLERKQQLMPLLEGVPAHKLRQAKHMADRNQKLLGAALKGVQAAQRRLQMILSASKGFTSYDPHGRSRAISTQASSVEKRA